MCLSWADVMDYNFHEYINQLEWWIDNLILWNCSCKQETLKSELTFALLSISFEDVQGQRGSRDSFSLSGTLARFPKLREFETGCESCKLKLQLCLVSRFVSWKILSQWVSPGSSTVFFGKLLRLSEHPEAPWANENNKRTFLTVCMCTCTHAQAGACPSFFAWCAALLRFCCKPRNFSSMEVGFQPLVLGTLTPSYFGAVAGLCRFSSPLIPCYDDLKRWTFLADPDIHRSSHSICGSFSSPT